MKAWIRRLTNAWKTLPLDIRAIPLIPLKLSGDKKKYAEEHLERVCSRCPKNRRLTRDVNGEGKCWWDENWREGNYDIPADFGVTNFIRYYSGIETKLESYTSEEPTSTDDE